MPAEPSAKERCNKLLSAMMPFAEQMLEKHGQFHPFAAAMLVDGEVQFVSTFPETEHSSSQELLDITREGLRSGAAEDKYCSAGIAVDMKVTLEAWKEKRDAVVVFLDDREEYSIIVYFPCERKGFLKKSVVLGQAFGQPGEHLIFGPAL